MAISLHSSPQFVYACCLSENRSGFMNKILKLVLQGLRPAQPLGLTGYFLFWLFANADNYSRSVLLWVIPRRLYFPGLGILTTLVILFLMGLRVNSYGIRYLLHL